LQRGRQRRAAAEGHAGGKNRLDHRAAPGNPQPGFVHEAAEALFGVKQFVLGGIEHHPGDDLALVFQRDRHRPMRQPVQKVGGAVERINDPAPGRVFARFLAGFLAQPAVRGARAAQFFLDDPFRLSVGLGNEIAGPLGGNLKIFHLAKVLDKRAARLAGGLDHQVEVRAAVHGGTPVRQGVAIRGR
jgi:hypothetical protein